MTDTTARSGTLAARVAEEVLRETRQIPSYNDFGLQCAEEGFRRGIAAIVEILSGAAEAYDREGAAPVAVAVRTVAEEIADAG